MQRCGNCTLLNAAGALVCEVCSAPFAAQKNPCPACTFDNPPGAAECAVCEKPLRTIEAWKCSSCGDSRSDGTLECAHKACFDCHKQWITSCDADGKEPTCLTCEAEGVERKALTQDSLRLILGAELFKKRDEQLFAKAAGCLVDCPTPDCPARFELEEGIAERRTTCAQCRKTVLLGTASVAAVVAAALAGTAPVAAAPEAAASAEAAHNGAAAPGAIAPAGVAAAGAEAAAASAAVASRAAAKEVITLDGSSEEEGEEADLLAPWPAPRPAPADDVADGEEAVRRELPAMRVCPSCKMGIIKDADTCDKFQCRCGCRFCWRCGKAASASGLYTCRCTGSDHVAWDNVRNRPAAARKRRRDDTC